MVGTKDATTVSVGGVPSFGIVHAYSILMNCASIAHMPLWKETNATQRFELRLRHSRAATTAGSASNFDSSPSSALARLSLARRPRPGAEAWATRAIIFLTCRTLAPAATSSASSIGRMSSSCREPGGREEGRGAMRVLLGFHSSAGGVLRERRRRSTGYRSVAIVVEHSARFRSVAIAVVRVGEGGVYI